MRGPSGQWHVFEDSKTVRYKSLQLTANLRAHRSHPRYVVYDADFTECLARFHRIEDSESVLWHDFDDAVLDEEYLVGYVVFAHDVLVTQVVGGMQATCYGTNDVCVRVTEQSDAAIQYRVTLSLLLSKTNTMCSEKNTYSHFHSYLHEWFVDLSKNCGEYT